MNPISPDSVIARMRAAQAQRSTLWLTQDDLAVLNAHLARVHSVELHAVAVVDEWETTPERVREDVERGDDDLHDAIVDLVTDVRENPDPRTRP